MHARSLLVAQYRDAARRQPPRQIAERFIAHNGLVAIVRARPVDQHHSWNRPLPDRNGKRPRQFPGTALVQLHFAVTECISLDVIGSFVLRAGGRYEAEAYDLAVAVEREPSVE